MIQRTAETETRKPPLDQKRESPTRKGSWVALKRGVAFSVSAALAALILTSALPPLVADQSDRAVVNAPVMLLTAPIEGEIDSLAAAPGDKLDSQSRIAEIVNSRVDRSTLITLEGKLSDTQQNLLAIRARKDSDIHYVSAITMEIARQTDALDERFQNQIVELKAQLGAANAAAVEKSQVVHRQAVLVARDIASPELVQAATQQYAGAKFQTQSSEAKLQEKQSQLDSERKGIFVGDDVQQLAALAQRKRDMELEIQRLGIEETQVAGVMEDQKKVLDGERIRLASLERSIVSAPGRGEIVFVGASVGRHVNAGDTLARMVDCDSSFVVAIFSYRQGSSFAPGTRVWIDAGPSGTSEGTVTAVLPKTSDKVDEAYAIPFPQTERRELYVFVSPDHPLRRSDASGVLSQCDIGRWVTVTRTGGWAPSNSVLWGKARQDILGLAAAIQGPANLGWRALGSNEASGKQLHGFGAAAKSTGAESVN